MDYLSSKELSEKWGIGQRRIIRLARDGRIPGAKQFGKTWMFPEDAIKPADGRTRATKAAVGRVAEERIENERSGFGRNGGDQVAEERPANTGIENERSGFGRNESAPGGAGCGRSEYTQIVPDGAGFGRNESVPGGASTAADDFRFPIFEYKDAASFDPPLNDEELTLKEFVELFNACRFKEAERLAAALPEKSQNRYTRIHALYCGCMLDIMICDTGRFLDRYGQLRSELVEDFPHKEEMLEFVHEIDSTLGADEYYAHDFNAGVTCHYHESFLPRMCNLEGFCLTLGSAAKSPAALKASELNCRFLEKTDNYFDLQSLHIFLGCAYAIASRTAERDYHFGKALVLAEKYDMFYNLATQYYYMRREFEPALHGYSEQFTEKLNRLSIELRRRLARFSDDLQISNIYAMLTTNDNIYVVYALQGLSNKEVASRLHISVGSVGKKYGDIYTLLGVKNKAELVEMYNKVSRGRVP